MKPHTTELPIAQPILANSAQRARWSRLGRVRQSGSGFALMLGVAQLLGCGSGSAQVDPTPATTTCAQCLVEWDDAPTKQELLDAIGWDQSREACDDPNIVTNDPICNYEVSRCESETEGTLVRIEDYYGLGGATWIYGAGPDLVAAAGFTDILSDSCDTPTTWWVGPDVCGCAWEPFQWGTAF